MFVRIIASALALVPLHQAVAAGLPERSGSARAGLPALFSADDYPADAISANEQGTVTADLEIAPNGKISRCTVSQSASPALDARTCSVLQERASYPPFRDGNGRLVGTRDKVTIRWVLPERQAEKFADSWLEMSALVPTAGPNRCTARASGPIPSVSQSQCDQFVRSNAGDRPATIAPPFLLTIREEHLVGEGTGQLLKGDQVARVLVRMHVDAEGYVSSCSVLPEPEPAVDDTHFFPCPINLQYEPLSADAPNKADRIMTGSWMRSFAAAPAERK